MRDLVEAFIVATFLIYFCTLGYVHPNLDLGMKWLLVIFMLIPEFSSQKKKMNIVV